MKQAPVPQDAGRLSDRRRETFDALLDTTRAVLADVGYERLTVRSVAAAAALTHTTAYSFVGSKAQLVAELYLREMRGLDPSEIDRFTAPIDRVTAAIEGPATLFAHEPNVAHAVQAALLEGDGTSDVGSLRARIGAITIGRIRHAIPDASDELVNVIFAAFNGALITAGTGHGTHDDVVATVRSLMAMIESAR